MPLTIDDQIIALVDASGSYMDRRAGDTVDLVSQSVFLIGGVSGSTTTFIKTDNSGSLFVTASSGLTVNQGAPNTLNSPWPVLLTSGGQAFGTTTNPLFVSTSFSSPASGALPSQFAVVGGYDFENNRIRPIRVDENGFVTTKAQHGEATFIAVASGTQLDLNKSLFSIYNSGSSSPVVIKIRRINIINTQTVNVGGTVVLFELRKFASHSAGTDISPQTMDSADVLNSRITAKTNGTITGESSNSIIRYIWSSDDWNANNSVVEAADHAIQTLIPAWNLNEHNTKPLTLRANEGLTIKNTINTTAGTFDIVVVFTQEDF
jgi:hypothetical protein